MRDLVLLSLTVSRARRTSVSLDLKSRACPLDIGHTPLREARGGAKKETNCARTVLKNDTGDVKAALRW